MYRIPTILFVILFSAKAAFATGDTLLLKTGVAINIGELIDIPQSEPNLRIAVEYVFANHYSLMAEPGMYFTGNGYNLRMELKKYYRHLSKKNNGQNYIGITAFYKKHFYSPSEQCYTDSTESSVTGKKIYVEKTALTFDLLIGKIYTWHNIYFDIYGGLGIRFRNVSGITDAQYYLMEDDWGRNTLIPGHHALPEITAGVRIGMKVKRKPKKL